MHRFQITNHKPRFVGPKKSSELECGKPPAAKNKENAAHLPLLIPNKWNESTRFCVTVACDLGNSELSYVIQTWVFDLEK